MAGKWRAKSGGLKVKITIGVILIVLTLLYFDPVVGGVVGFVIVLIMASLPSLIKAGADTAGDLRGQAYEKMRRRRDHY